jgi:hypothetical protein
MTTIALGLDVVDPSVAIPAYDLYLDAAGQLAFHTTTDRIVAQAVVTRLRTMLGEWYQDPTIGIDYLGQVLVKNPNVATLQRYFSSQVAAVPGVATVNSVVCTFNAGTRTLSVNFRVTASDGTVVTGGV